VSSSPALAVGAAPCYTDSVPTTRPRHTVTETPPVQEALSELRTEMRSDAAIDFAELVVLGARVKARHLRTEHRAVQGAAQRLAGMIRGGSMPFALDLGAAQEVKHIGLLDGSA
jgi:hypothetical protein